MQNTFSLVSRQPYTAKTLFPLLAVPVLIVVGMFFGLVATFLPWWFVIAASVLPLFVVAVFYYPQISSVILIAVVAGVVPSFLLPQISLGAGKVLPQDLFLVVLLGLALLRIWSGKIPNIFQTGKPISLFILGLFVCAVFATAIGGLFYGAAAKDAISEFRDKIYWLVFFLPLAFVRTERDIKLITGAFVLLGLWISIAVLIQFQFGITVLENARVEDLATGSMKYSDITRSTAGGAIYWPIFVLLLSAARILNRTGNVFWSLIVATICAAGVLVSFGRGIWISSFFALLIVARYFGGTKAVIGAVMFALVSVSLAIIPLTILKPAFFDALSHRLISTKDEGSGKSSLGWRLEENSFAFKKITQNPITGTGLAVTYKPRFDLLAPWDQVRYIHNSYLGLWMKMGIAALLFSGALVWKTLATANSTIRIYRNAPFIELQTAAAAAFLVPVITGVTQPEWLIASGISFFAMMSGLIIAFRNLADNSKL